MLEKKFVSIILAVIAFFAGAIITTESPIVATLIDFFLVAAGFGCGLMCRSDVFKKKYAVLQDECITLREELAKKNEVPKVRISTSSSKKKTTTK